MLLDNYHAPVHVSVYTLDSIFGLQLFQNSARIWQSNAVHSQITTENSMLESKVTAPVPNVSHCALDGLTIPTATYGG